MKGKPHQQKPDIDNVTKGIFDSLKDEDSGIHYLIASKVWTSEGDSKIMIDNLEF